MNSVSNAIARCRGLMALGLSAMMMTACLDTTRNPLDPNTAAGYLTGTLLLGTSVSGVSFSLAHEATSVYVGHQGYLYFSGTTAAVNTMATTRIAPLTGPAYPSTHTFGGISSAYTSVGDDSDTANHYTFTNAGVFQFVQGSGTLQPTNFSMFLPNISSRQVYDPVLGVTVVRDTSTDIRCYNPGTGAWNTGGTLSVGSPFLVEDPPGTFLTIFIPQDGTAIRKVTTPACVTTIESTTILSGSDMPFSLTYASQLNGPSVSGNSYMVANFSSPKLIECANVPATQCGSGNMTDITSQLNLGGGETVQGVAASATVLVILVKPATTGDPIVYVRSIANNNTYDRYVISAVGSTKPQALWIAYSTATGAFYMSGGSNAIDTEIVLRSSDGITWVQ